MSALERAAAKLCSSQQRASDTRPSSRNLRHESAEHAQSRTTRRRLPQKYRKVPRLLSFQVTGSCSVLSYWQSAQRTCSKSPEVCWHVTSCKSASRLTIVRTRRPLLYSSRVV